MAILKIKDANGNVQEILAIRGNDGKDGADGIDGKDYVLTEADKQEIANMVGGGGGSGADLSNYYTKAETDAAITEHSENTSNPHNVTAEQVGAYTKDETDTAISDAVSNIDVPDVDLSDYYTKAETDGICVKKLDKSNFDAVYSGVYSTGLEIEGDTVVGIGDCGEDEHIVIPEFAPDGTKITDVADGVFGANLINDHVHIRTITFPPSINKLHGEVVNTAYCSNLKALYVMNPYIEWDNTGETATEAIAIDNRAMAENELDFFYGSTRETWRDINTSGDCTLVKFFGNAPLMHYAHFTTKEQVLALIRECMPVSGDEESY